MANESTGKQVMVQGRIVWVSGDLFKGQVKTAFGTKTPLLNQQGEQQTQYGFGLAIPKANCAEIWNAIHEEAYTLYPSRQLPPAFAMKFKDGDTGIDDKGIPYSQREGYAGHLVFSCTTQLPIKFFRWENGVVAINEGIKCGDFVQVQLSIKAHGAIGQGKPGLYVNPNAVLFLGYGAAIINAPSGDQIFGSQAPALPPGASAVPLAQPGFNPGAPVMPPQAPPFQGYSAPPAAQETALQPHYGVLPPQHQPTPQPYPQPGAPPGFSQPPGYGAVAQPPTVAPQPQQAWQPPQGQVPMPQFPQR